MPTKHIPDPCLADILHRNAERFGDVPAYLYEGRSVTHRELLRRATAIAAALARAGLRRQDRVALLGRNSIAFGEVLAAGQLSGLVIATVNFRLAAPEIARILTDAKPRAIFVDAEFLPIVAALRAELGLELVVRLDDPAAGSAGGEVVGLAEFRDAALDDALPFAARPDDIACLIYTSGTTGRPKGCIMGQREMFRVGQTMNVEMRTGSDDRILLVMPLFHIGAMAMAFGLHARGGTAVLHRQFEPAALLATVPADGITVLHLAPSMLQAVLTEAGAGPGVADPAPVGALRGVRSIVYSAAPITAPTLAAALAAMPDTGFLNLYGQTEVITSGLPRELHRGSGPDRDRRLTSVGFPYPDTEIRILDDDGVECPPGVPGEIVVASPAMFRGYWNDSATTGVTLADGWCHTGDVGVFDEEGLLHLVDRKKDVIISGGENIYSLEVEDAVLTHPAVVQCAVVGVPDERWGEAVCAVVVLAPGAESGAGAELISGELREHVATRIARYKSPRYAVIVDELPVLPTGKIDKKALRARLAAAPREAPREVRA
ncbi:acyl-CoA synthetase (AMP-forming)/AMP-acid ligase II [Frankia torreyi]|uniref:Acyl-CoA synthetase (AMP-forming)/AMP-acid ligase II n=3 Tax=Frankia TaxID=1854 RepID=A0A0D8BE14_9ACTN|nr:MULTISPECIES: AMP-binding protein [Frankia]KJE22513.1 acyl-CoA synthetase (AMP-forming)/AMP-acid ligase II [Frankia torreyi]